MACTHVLAWLMAKSVSWNLGKIIFYTAVLEAWAIHMGGNESGSLPHTTHIQNKMMSWVKDLYTKAKLIKFLESNPGKYL